MLGLRSKYIFKLIGGDAPGIEPVRFSHGETNRPRYPFSLVNLFHVCVAINAASIAALTGYLAVEYLWPYIRRRFFSPNLIQRKLQLEHPISLTKHEEELACSAVHPSEINVSFDSSHS